MNTKEFCDSIVRMHLYSNMVKYIHLTTDIARLHTICDEVEGEIRKFVDSLCEQYFGYYGKPKFSDFKYTSNIYEEEDLVKLLNRVFDIVTYIKDELSSVDKLSGIISLIDDFTGTLNKYIYLCSFDKISSYKSEDKTD